MFNCCANNSPEPKNQNCPQCGARCKSVALKTFWHNLKFPDYLSTPADTYYFCPSEHCQVGYFSSTSVIAKHALKAHPQIQQGWLCYCFDLSEAQYRSALKTGSAETIKNFIIQQTKSGSCACEIKNPSGQCCLAKIKDIEKTQE